MFIKFIVQYILKNEENRNKNRVRIQICSKPRSMVAETVTYGTLVVTTHNSR